MLISNSEGRSGSIRVSIQSGGPSATALFKAGFEAAGCEVCLSPRAGPDSTDPRDFWRVVRVMIDEVHDAPRISVLAYDLLKSGKAIGVEEVIVLGPAAEELRRVSVGGHHWRENAEI